MWGGSRRELMRDENTTHHCIAPCRFESILQIGLIQRWLHRGLAPRRAYKQILAIIDIWEVIEEKAMQPYLNGEVYATTRLRKGDMLPCSGSFVDILVCTSKRKIEVHEWKCSTLQRVGATNQPVSYKRKTRRSVHFCINLPVRISQNMPVTSTTITNHP